MALSFLANSSEAQAFFFAIWLRYTIATVHISLLKVPRYVEKMLDLFSLNQGMWLELLILLKTINTPIGSITRLLMMLKSGSIKAKIIKAVGGRTGPIKRCTQIVTDLYC